MELWISSIRQLIEVWFVLDKILHLSLYYGQCTSTDGRSSNIYLRIDRGLDVNVQEFIIMGEGGAPFIEE